MPSVRFLDALRERVLVGDGAMGTYLYAKGVPFTVCYEELNRSRPDLIREVHRDYVRAGAGFLETNTFNANRFRLEAFHLEERAPELNRRGAELARQEAGAQAYVGGAVGPLTDPSRADRPPLAERRRAFEEQIDALLQGGCDVILFETFSDLDELLCGVEVAKARGAIVIAQLAYMEQARTATGTGARQALRALEKAGADVIGANCGQGPQGTLRVIQRLGGATQRPLSAFPNAGFPKYVDGRYIYLSTPEYIASLAEEMAAAGANLLGGCCGTGPAEVRAVAERLHGRAPAERRPEPPAQPVKAKHKAPPAFPPARFSEKLGRETIIAAEVDPPKGLRLETSLASAARLVEAGVDAITVGDNPLAILRMGHTAFSHLILQRARTDIILHMSCRDRNLIGTQSELMGAAALGITSVLCLTGDPAKIGPQAGASSVYDLNSFELIRLVAQMNQGLNAMGNPLGRRTNFSIGASFNPNVRYMDMQVKRLEKKIAAGAQFAMTQPVFSTAAVEAMAEHTRSLAFPILCGVMPLVSLRNAEYLHGEVPGIVISESVKDRMAKAGEEGGEAEGLAICRDVIDAALAHGFGIYFITPFGNADLILPLVRHARERAAPRATRTPHAEAPQGHPHASP